VNGLCRAGKHFFYSSALEILPAFAGRSARATQSFL
jgi:hypothetical protein